MTTLKDLFDQTELAEIKKIAQERIFRDGHEDALNGYCCIVRGSSLLEVEPDREDVDGNPIEPDALYEHDWNDTGDCFKIESADQLSDSVDYLMGRELPRNMDKHEAIDWICEDVL